MSYNILYRSKREYESKSMVWFANDQAEALRSLGCIPRTPSPEAVLACGTSSTETEVVPKTEASNVQVLERENVALRLRNKDVSTNEAQLTQLQLRLALLEQQIGGKSEASNEVVKREGIKRERIDGQADSARKRSRTSRRIEVLDLTED